MSGSVGGLLASVFLSVCPQGRLAGDVNIGQRAQPAHRSLHQRHSPAGLTYYITLCLVEFKLRALIALTAHTMCLATANSYKMLAVQPLPQKVNDEDINNNSYVLK